MRKWITRMLEICREYHQEEQEKIIAEEERAAIASGKEIERREVIPYKVVPKTHHIQHYPDEIQYYGPTALFTGIAIT